LLHNYLHPPVISSFFDKNILLGTLLSNTLHTSQLSTATRDLCEENPEVAWSAERNVEREGKNL
jgi:hypothetical protein